MNNNLKIGIASIVSFTAGYLVSNWRNESFYYKQAQEKVDEVREELADKISQAESSRDAHEKMMEVAEASIAMQAEEALKAYQTAGVKPVAIGSSPQRTTPAVQYSNYSAKEAENQKPREVEEKKENIEVITPEQYAEGTDDYEQPTYVYYPGDDILADGFVGDGGVGVVDEDLRKMMLGSRADLLSREGFWEGLGDDAFYLRNHDLKIDIEIILAEEDIKYYNAPESKGDHG